MSYEHTAAEVARAGSREEDQVAAPDVDRQGKPRWRGILALPPRLIGPSKPASVK